MRYYYTTAQYKELCAGIEILHDTREQVNEHITSWLDKKGIKHSRRALHVGDYSFKISDEISDRYAGAWFDDDLFIERKNSLDELAGSILEQRFHRELKEAKLIPHKYLLIENAAGEHDILAHKYRSRYDEKAFLATLNTLEYRYQLHIIYLPEPAYTAQKIYNICKTALAAIVKKG